MQSEQPSSRIHVLLSLITGAIAGALVVALATRKPGANKPPKLWWPC
jgi:hypothetical protein